MILAEAMNALLPGAQYRGNVDDSTEEQYNTVEWCDDRPKPEWPVVQAMMATDTAYYSPDKIVCAIDAMGQLPQLEGMLQAASPRIRLRWQKAVEFNGDDPDFISMVDYFQVAWGLTDEQRKAFLKQCEM